MASAAVQAINPFAFLPALLCALRVLCGETRETTPCFFSLPKPNYPNFPAFGGKDFGPLTVGYC